MTENSEIDNVLGLRHFSQNLQLVRLQYQDARTGQNPIDPTTIEEKYVPNLRRRLDQLISGELPFKETVSVTITTLQQVRDGFDRMLQLVQEASDDLGRFNAVNIFFGGLFKYLDQYEREAAGSEEFVGELISPLFRPDGGRRPK